MDKVNELGLIPRVKVKPGFAEHYFLMSEFFQEIPRLKKLFHAERNDRNLRFLVTANIPKKYWNFEWNTIISSY